MSLKIDKDALLQEMYRDDYFPNHLVDKLRDIILGVCADIETRQPENLPALYCITCQATEQINELQQAFEDSGSEIETAARDDIAMAFQLVAKTYGFDNADLEEMVATRDW
ncbi:DUF5713 family protein [Gynuella sunshinyii]|uniref:Uncharacterized protein n=1 Tax=Gynuella sunshinyii YC6258 TaxID=1445510 RepID=A0A0C5VWX6_9GAMM|nr:DUF5713 family protein [Gynuella sunshinyii]AJQ97798.1 hypothetical Protein YC6258_05770 [Gynuella sunshinyii YC6258]